MNSWSDPSAGMAGAQPEYTVQVNGNPAVTPQRPAPPAQPRAETRRASVQVKQRQPQPQPQLQPQPELASIQEAQTAELESRAALSGLPFHKLSGGALKRPELTAQPVLKQPAATAQPLPARRDRAASAGVLGLSWW